MYDGLSRKDMQVILAHQEWLHCNHAQSIETCMLSAYAFLNQVEGIEAAREVKFCEFGEGDA